MRRRPSGGEDGSGVPAGGGQVACAKQQRGEPRETMGSGNEPPKMRRRPSGARMAVGYQREVVSHKQQREVQGRERQWASERRGKRRGAGDGGVYR